VKIGKKTPRCMWEDNIRMDLREIACQKGLLLHGVGWLVNQLVTLMIIRGNGATCPCFYVDLLTR
jgi:hypothetical protein